MAVTIVGTLEQIFTSGGEAVSEAVHVEFTSPTDAPLDLATSLVFPDRTPPADVRVPLEAHLADDHGFTSVTRVVTPRAGAMAEWTATRPDSVATEIVLWEIVPLQQEGVEWGVTVVSDEGALWAYQSIPIGDGAEATGEASIAIGYNAKSTEESSTAMGHDANADGKQSLAVGRGSNAGGDNSIAIGVDSDATGLDSTAIGQDANATNDQATAVGRAANASGWRSSAYGTGSEAVGDYSVAVGTGAASGHSGTAVGDNAEVVDGGVAAGRNAKSLAESASAIGAGASASGLGANAVGYLASASGNSANAIGYSASADGIGANAIGSGAIASGARANAIGISASASGTNANAIGDSASASGDGANAIGNNASAGDFSNAVGYLASASGTNANAIGNDASAGAFFSNAIGYKARVPATSPRSQAYGDSATVPENTPDTAVVSAKSLNLKPTEYASTLASTITLYDAAGNPHVIPATVGQTHSFSNNASPAGENLTGVGTYATAGVLKTGTLQSLIPAITSGLWDVNVEASALVYRSVATGGVYLFVGNGTTAMTQALGRLSPQTHAYTLTMFASPHMGLAAVSPSQVIDLRYTGFSTAGTTHVVNHGWKITARRVG